MSLDGRRAHKGCMIRPPYGHCPYNTPKPPMGCCLFKSGFRFTPYLAVGFACRKCGSFSHLPHICAGIPRFSAHYAEAIMDAICSSQIFGHSYSLTQSACADIIRTPRRNHRWGAACSGQAFDISLLTLLWPNPAKGSTI